MNTSNRVWAVIGGGHGGQTFAGHLGLLGERVRLYSESKAAEILKAGGIELHGALQGFGKLELVTSSMREVVNGATDIVIVLPSIYHAKVSKLLIPYLKTGQRILILPESSCGALAFRHELMRQRCRTDVIVGAGNTLPYVTRSRMPGVCDVVCVKSEVKIAALPAKDNPFLISPYRELFHGFKLAKNVVETSIDNINALVHPGVVLLNVSRIEANPSQTYEYYREGVTHSVGELLESVDNERISVAKALGVSQRTLRQTFLEMYNCGMPHMTMAEVIQSNSGYAGVMNLKSLNERQFMEDIPYSLESIRSLGQIAEIPTPCIDAICILGRAIMKNIMDEGRTLRNLGLEGISKEDFLMYVNGK